VRHFLGRGFLGKAMVVSIDKATALRMHDKVRGHWQLETARVRKELGLLGYAPERDEPDVAKREQMAELASRLTVLTTTDMAVIVSPGQNEIAQMKALGLDIEPHRRRMNDSQPRLDERFKDTQDPLRLVFVCAMWLTGFDAPSCSTVYLDKPMRNHTLMQTIARANRVFAGKHSGTIVDYANVFASLEKALAIYGAGRGGVSPVRDKRELVDQLRATIADANGFCAGHGVSLAAIGKLPVGGLERLQAIDDAMEALIAPDEARRDFFARERLAATLYKAVMPDPAALEFSGVVACMASLFQELLKLSRSLDDEQERHVRENMTEEELVIFDILTRPAPELSPEECAEVKKVARELLTRLKELLILNWRQKSAARATLRIAIEDVLDKGLPRAYTPEMYQGKCPCVYR
jgi:type I restriction enzyme R subunit